MTVLQGTLTMTSRHRRRTIRFTGLFVAMMMAATPALAQQSNRPYDQKIYRLSEILGAIHYLRELCGAAEGQRWRDSMQELLEAEGANAVKRATLSQRFNRGYRGYSRTYRSCTASAQATIERFLKEAIEISDGLIKLAK